jgi:fructokinase
MATVPHVDLLKVNEVELALLGGSEDVDAATEALLELGPDLCVVTLGPDGSFFGIADGSEYIPPFRVDTVDATGCGDAFVAGLLCQLIVGADWRDQLSVARMREILRYANAVGALTALTQGVIPALPTTDRVDAFLSQQG